MPKPYQIKAKGDNSAELLVFGDIGESWWGDSVTAKDVVKELQALDVEYLDVRINSYGGSVSDGVAIYNAIKRHSAATTVYIEGVAVSIASLIAMAGDTVEMAENALMMIHAPWSGAVGNAKELRQHADVLDTYAEAMTSSYVSKSGQSHDDVLNLLTDGEDHWYTASEAKEEGFVDVVSEDQSIAAAGFDHSKFANSGMHHAIAQMNPAPAQVIEPTPKPAAQVAATTEVNKGGEMPKPENNPATNTPVAKSEKEIVAEFKAKDKQRKSDINNSFKAFAGREGVDEILNTCLHDTDCDAQSANDKLLAHLGKDSESLASGGNFDVVEDEKEKLIKGASQALMARMGQGEQDRANPYRGMSLSEMAKDCLSRSGMDVKGMTAEEFAPAALSNGVVRGAQTTSDFPVILENTMHKMVLTGFDAQPTTWERFCKIGDVTDFRAWNRLVPGLIGNLDSVNERGEYKDKVIPDAEKNSIQATRKGNIINVTPEIIVNDDIGYFQDMSLSIGQAGGRAIERAVYTLLESNPTMSDGTVLFHADHGNLAGSGAAPTVTLLDSAGNAMAQQTAPGDDAEYLDIRPAAALVNTALRGDMMVLVEAQYDPDTANKLQRPNKVRGIVGDVVSTPRIAAAPWYLFADPAMAPVIEVVFLNGQRAPRIVQEENFRTGGLAWRIEMPFGVGAIDHRGAYKNPGV